MNTIYNATLVEQFWLRMQAGKKAVLFGHKNPDGDALGATLAMAQLLENSGLSTRVIVPDAFPGFYSWMPKADTVWVYDGNEQACEEAIQQADELLFMDFNQYGRLGNITKNIVLEPQKVVLIDHHPNPCSDVDMLFSHPAASSTCEMVYRLVAEGNKHDLLNAGIAACLLTGMVTDTGGFSYNAETPDFFGVVSALLTAGAVKSEVFNQVFYNNNESRFRLLGTVLQNNLSLNYSLGVAVMWLSASDLERNGFQKGDTEGFVNMPLSIRGIQKSVLVTEHADEVKLSFRSQGDAAVNGFAEKYFNGGGHRNAAGGHSKESFENTLKRLMKNLEKL